MAHDLRADFHSLTAALPPLSRRGFVMTASAAVGFAAAAGPVSAETVIETDTEGLEAGDSAFTATDGTEVPVYFARPADDASAPVILVIQEIFGVHEHIKDVCRRLGKAGYFAVAPELYNRQGDPSGYDDIQTLLSEVVSQVPDEQVMSDLDDCVAWAAAEGGDTERLGITGFCWGGRVTWLYAAHNPDLSAGVAWYGRLVGETSDATPQHPIDVAADLNAPVLGLYGGADSGIPVDTVEEMRSALEEAEQSFEIVVYPDAPHAFHADYRPSYREAPAQDGWERLLAWFDQHIAAA